jgi:phosphomannomutase
MYAIPIDFPHVTAVRHVAGHTLWLRFSDGVEGTVDFAGWLEGDVFQPLEDEAFFAQVTVEHEYTLAWPNGADLAPESLYDRLVATGTVAKRDYRKLFDDARKSEAAECAAMPEVSRFYGMVIHMFWTEHEAPHFHARYGEFIASIRINDGRVTSRDFPPRALRHLDEWRKLHKGELLANWERMRRDQPPLPIAPLE